MLQVAAKKSSFGEWVIGVLDCSLNAYQMFVEMLVGGSMVRTAVVEIYNAVELCCKLEL